MLQSRTCEVLPFHERDLIRFLGYWADRSRVTFVRKLMVYIVRLVAIFLFPPTPHCIISLLLFILQLKRPLSHASKALFLSTGSRVWARFGPFYYESELKDISHPAAV